MPVQIESINLQMTEKKNGNQKTEMKFDLERMENMGKENLGIFSFSHYVFKGKNITFIQFHNINFASN